MTSEQNPGFPPNGGANGVPPQAPGPVPSTYSNQGAAPQNQPAAPNGPVYQAPPGYAVANGQLTAVPVTKSRRGLVIGILAVSLVLVLAVVLFVLLGFFPCLVALRQGAGLRARPRTMLFPG